MDKLATSTQASTVSSDRVPFWRRFFSFDVLFVLLLAGIKPCQFGVSAKACGGADILGAGIFKQENIMSKELGGAFRDFLLLHLPGILLGCEASPTECQQKGVGHGWPKPMWLLSLHGAGILWLHYILTISPSLRFWKARDHSFRCVQQYQIEFVEDGRNAQSGSM